MPLGSFFSTLNYVFVFGVFFVHKTEKEAATGRRVVIIPRFFVRHSRLVSLENDPLCKAVKGQNNELCCVEWDGMVVALCVAFALRRSSPTIPVDDNALGIPSPRFLFCRSLFRFASSGRFCRNPPLACSVLVVVVGLVVGLELFLF
jgi:hypothetical protein